MTAPPIPIHQRIVTAASRKVDAVTHQMLGRKNIRTMNVSVEQGLENDYELSTEIVSVVSDQIAVECATEALAKARALTHRDAFKIAWVDDLSIGDWAVERRAENARFIAALLKHTTREHHDQSDRVVFMSPTVYSILAAFKVISILDGDEAKTLDDDAFLQSRGTFNGAKVLVETGAGPYDAVVVAKEGWLTYAGEGLSASPAGSIVLDRIVEVDPSKVVILLTNSDFHSAEG
jgi:hypothetical protein